MICMIHLIGLVGGLFRAKVEDFLRLRRPEMKWKTGGTPGFLGSSVQRVQPVNLNLSMGLTDCFVVRPLGLFSTAGTFIM